MTVEIGYTYHLGPLSYTDPSKFSDEQLLFVTKKERVVPEMAPLVVEVWDAHNEVWAAHTHPEIVRLRERCPLYQPHFCDWAESGAEMFPEMVEAIQAEHDRLFNSRFDRPEKMVVEGDFVADWPQTPKQWVLRR
jgi:hypothetical protein